MLGYSLLFSSFTLGKSGPRPDKPISQLNVSCSIFEDDYVSEVDIFNSIADIMSTMFDSACPDIQLPTMNIAFDGGGTISIGEQGQICMAAKPKEFTKNESLCKYNFELFILMILAIGIAIINTVIAIFIYKSSELDKSRSYISVQQESAENVALQTRI